MKLGKKIKELRLKNEMTQEILARLIGVSMQSVSRWENEQTYPDITLLPILANVFQVSTDELLGVDMYKKDEYITKVLEEDSQFANQGDSLARIKLLKDTLKKYPKNFIIMDKLVGALHGYFCADDLARKDVLVELIDLCEKMVYECRDDHMKNNAIQTLCFAYDYNNETDKAIALANKMPSFHSTKNNLLASILKGEEKSKQVQDNIISMIEYLYVSITSLRKSDPEYNIKLYEKYIDILNVVFEEQDFGFYNIRLMECYLGLARNYARLNTVDKAIDCLNKSIEYAKDYQTRPSKSKHTSILFDRIEDEKDMSVKNTIYTEKDLISFALEKPMFAKVKEDNRFQEIIDKLNGIH